MIDQAEIHRKTMSDSAEERIEAIDQLKNNFAVLSDKHQAWNDLIRFTKNKDWHVRWRTATALEAVFPLISNKEDAWNDLIRFTKSEDSTFVLKWIKTLSKEFPHAPNKDQAWSDLVWLAKNVYPQRRAFAALGKAFPHVINKDQAWSDLVQLAKDKDWHLRWNVLEALFAAFFNLSDSDKERAWNTLIRLIREEKNWYVRRDMVKQLGIAISHAPDKEWAWMGLMQLTEAEDWRVRLMAVKQLGIAIAHVPNKERAWMDLVRMTEDEDSYVRLSSTYSLGMASIFNATEAESIKKFKEDIENALMYFEKVANEAPFFNPAKFCDLLYRSYYLAMFGQKAGDEAHKYLIEAKKLVGESESREKLLEAVENISAALNEVEETQDLDLGILKRDLIAYWRYCNRAVELLDDTEEKAPGATRLIRRGLPIIDQKIRELLSEIKEESRSICETAALPEAELGCVIEKHAMGAIKTDNPNEILRSVNNILNDFHIWSQTLKDETEREYIQGIISDAKDETLGGRVLHIRTLVARVLEFSKDKRYEKSKAHSHLEKIFERDDFPYKTEFESEISDLFKSVYQKEREKGGSDVNSKTLTFLKTKLHDLNAENRPFTWLDVGCGYGRALDVLDALDVPRDIVEYHGIDAVHKYLDNAERQARKHKLGNPKIEKMDAAQMHFDSEFDLVSAVLLLHEVDPLCLPYVIKNMIRALKTEGTLVISDFQGPYEQEEGIVAWSAGDIKHLLESICGEAKASFEPLPAGKYPKELGFYACYVKKSTIDIETFEKFMENYKEFLKRKKAASKNMRNELRQEIKERVKEILGRSDIDSKNISDEEMEKIKDEIDAEYGIQAHKIRLLTNQIEFLDDKIAEFNSGKRCAGAD